MKNFTLLHGWQTRMLILSICIALVGTLNAQTFEAKLTGHQEALPVETGASGQVSATLAGTQLVVTGNFSGLESDYDASIGSHLHLAPAGSNGPVQFSLTPTVNANQRGGSYAAAANTFTLTATQIAALNQYGMYVNIHTVNNGSGELRGQLVPQGGTVYTMNMFGSSEVPSALTEAHGAILLHLNGTQLTVSGSFEDLEGDVDVTIAGGAHLHQGLAGQNGAILFSLNLELDAGLRSGVFLSDSNSFNLSSAQVSMLNDRMVYSNIHTTKYPMGELRGQISAQPQMVFRGYFNGAQEVPVVTSSGRGELQVEIDGANMVLSGSFANLSSPFDPNVAGGAHLHTAMAGSTGGIAVSINTTMDANMLGGIMPAASNSSAISQGLIDTIRNRGIYANIHTLANAPGEIRAQIVGEGQIFFQAFMTGNLGVPTVLTTAQGYLIGELRGDQLLATGSFSDLESDFDATVAGGSHLHTGFAGATGGILESLTANVNNDLRGGTFDTTGNMITLSAAAIADLRARKIYSNIHTVDHQPGELRGQMLLEAEAYYIANLSGASARPIINTGATGAVVAEYSSGSIVLTGSLDNLESDFDPSVAGGAHVHDGMAGQSGGISLFMGATPAASNRQVDFTASQNIFDISQGLLDTINHRGKYVNIHTVDNGAGEIRGQLLPLANSYLSANLRGLNEVNPVVSAGNGAIQIERVGDQITATGSFNGIAGNYAASHIHTGLAGVNGGVVYGLAPAVDANMKEGTFMSDSNVYNLSSNEIDLLMSDEMYINLHTNLFPGGELRGQLLSEINMYPGQSSITAPADGLTAAINGDQNSMVTIDWTMVSDPDDHRVVYSWQLSLDSSFSANIVDTNVQTGMQLMFDHEMLRAILDGQGVSRGDTAQLFHRVIASDGSLNNVSTISSVNLINENPLSTNSIDEDLFNVSVYPNPTNGIVWLKIKTSNPDDVAVNITDITGKQVSSTVYSSNPGTQLINLNLSSEPQGVYLLNVESTEEKSTQRIVIR